MKRMAKVDLVNIKAYADRHGRMRYYYRRKGFPAVTLPGEPGSPAFLEAYAAAGAAAPKARPASDRVQPRSISALMIEYYRSPEFMALAPQTQANYRNILDRFRAKFGHKGVAGVETRHLDSIFRDMAATPGAAANLRLRLNRVFRLAVKMAWRDSNPVRDSEAKRKKSDGFVPWTEEEIATYEAFWPEGTRERLALALLLYTAVRRSDVVKMGRQHISSGRISLRQTKGGAWIKIPIHPTLQAEIDRHPTALTFLVTQYGAPFTAPGFTQWFVERAVMAGIRNRTPHGLRKAAGRRLAEAGCSTKEIAAALGHRTLAEAETYTRDADQSRLADNALAGLLRAETRTGIV